MSTSMESLKPTWMETSWKFLGAPTPSSAKSLKPTSIETSWKLLEGMDSIEVILGKPNPHQQFTDQDNLVPHPLRLPTDECVEILNDAKVEFDVQGAAAVFSTWRVEEEDPLDISNNEIADGICMPEPALNAHIQMRGWLGCLLASQRAISFWNSNSCRSMLKAIGCSKISSTLSVLRERKDRPWLRSFGRRGWDYWQNSIKSTIRMPIPSPQSPWASTPSEIWTPPTSLH